MAHNDTVFAQVLKLVPRHEFESLARKHKSGRMSRSMTRWGQFVAMGMAQLTGRCSLRDIVSNLAAQSCKLYHLGVGVVTRSSLARVTAQARRDGEAHDDVRRGRTTAEVGALHVRGAGPVRRPRGALVSALRASREGVVRRRLCTACSKLPAASWRRGATDCPPCAACGSWAGAVRWVEGGEHDDEQMRRRLHVLEQDVAAVQRKLDSEFVACGYPRNPDQRRATDCLRLAVEHAGILRAQVALARMRVGVSLQGGIAGRLGE